MPREAAALDRDVRTVIVAGEYGMLGGTVLGLAAVPFTQDIRSMFIGTSVGLYLGIAIGIYYIHHRDDPSNPLRAGGAEFQPRPETLVASRLSSGEPIAHVDFQEKPRFRLTFPVIHF